MAKRRKAPGSQLIYAARPGGPVRDEQATLAGAERDMLVQEGVEPTPHALLDRARDPANPLHDKGGFDWNDQTAAEKHRVDWARTLLGSIVVVNITTRESSKALYSVDIQRGEGAATRREYRTRAEILGEENYLAQISAMRYSAVRAAVDDIVSLGLDRSDAKWSRICSTVRANEPSAVVEKRMRDGGEERAVG